MVWDMGSVVIDIECPITDIMYSRVSLRMRESVLDGFRGLFPSESGPAAYEMDYFQTVPCSQSGSGPAAAFDDVAVVFDGDAVAFEGQFRD